jgi:hypothetical protein
MNEFSDDILQAYRVDIETRTNPDGNQRRFPEGWKVNAHEIRVAFRVREVQYGLSPQMVTRWP